MWWRRRGTVDLVPCGWDLPTYPEFAAFHQWLLDPVGVTEEVYDRRRRWRPTCRRCDSCRITTHTRTRRCWSAGLDDVSVIVTDGSGELTATPKPEEVVRRRVRLDWDELLGPRQTDGLAANGRPNSTWRFPVTTSAEGCPIDKSDPVGRDQQHWTLRRQLEKQLAQCYPYALRISANVIKYADFAAAVGFAQERSGESLFELLLRSGDPDLLAIAGEVGINCSMIDRLAGLPAVRDLFAPPFAYYVGAAVAGEHSEASSPSRLRTAWLVLDFGDKEIAAELAEHGVTAARRDPTGSHGIYSGRCPRRRYRPSASGPAGDEPAVLGADRSIPAGDRCARCAEHIVQSSWLADRQLAAPGRRHLPGDRAGRTDDRAVPGQQEGRRLRLVRCGGRAR